MPIILIGNSLDMHRAEKAGMHELPGSIHLGRGVWAFKVTTISPEIRSLAEEVVAQPPAPFDDGWAERLGRESSRFND